LQTAKDFGAEGIKIRCAAVWAARNSRASKCITGPRAVAHAAREHDYGFAEAHTLYGSSASKCWICKGENKPENEKAAVSAPVEAPAN